MTNKLRKIGENAWVREEDILTKESRTFWDLKVSDDAYVPWRMEATIFRHETDPEKDDLPGAVCIEIWREIIRDKKSLLPENVIRLMNNLRKEIKKHNAESYWEYQEEMRVKE